MRAIINFAGLIFCLLWFSSVQAATCRDPEGFDAWLADFKKQAAANGIPGSAISALDGITYDPGIVAKDHGQHVFQQSFEQFSGRMVNFLSPAQRAGSDQTVCSHVYPHPAAG